MDYPEVERCGDWQITTGLSLTGTWHASGVPLFEGEPIYGQVRHHYGGSRQEAADNLKRELGLFDG